MAVSSAGAKNAVTVAMKRLITRISADVAADEDEEDDAAGPQEVRGEHDQAGVAALDEDAGDRAEGDRRHQEGQDQDRDWRCSSRWRCTTVAISAASTMLLASWLSSCATHSSTKLRLRKTVPAPDRSWLPRSWRQLELRLTLGLRLRAALEVPGEAPLDVQAVHQDPMAAAGADQADVGAEPLHPPLPGSRTGAALRSAIRSPMRSSTAANRQASDSAAVAPVKAKRPMRRAGTRALMPEYSAATSVCLGRRSPRCG